MGEVIVEDVLDMGMENPLNNPLLPPSVPQTWGMFFRLEAI